MNLLKKKQQRQPYECFTLTLSGDNYHAIEKLRLEGNFPDRDAVITALIQHLEVEK